MQFLAWKKRFWIAARVAGIKKGLRQPHPQVLSLSLSRDG